MKTLLAVLILATLNLTACTSTQEAQVASGITTGANTVTVAASLLPAKFTAGIKALVARHPQAKPYLVTVANALESIANAEKKLPAPDSTFNTLVSWTEFIPQIGSYVSDFEALYRLYYPTVAPTAAALTELAELIRADAA